MAGLRTVLVKLQTSFGERNRPVSFDGDASELVYAVKEKFNDVLSSNSDVYLQILDISWGDEIFVDLLDQDIPERSIIKAVEKKSTLFADKEPEADDVTTMVSSITSPPTLPPSPSSSSAHRISRQRKRINEVAQNICLKNPSMLRSRSKLLEAARKVVDKTYQFKKGKSRSKRHNPPSGLPKRQKVSKTTRLERMKHIEDDIRNIKERIAYKEKRRQIAEGMNGMKKYQLCDEITEEIGSLSKESRELSCELSLLLKKDECSKRYYRKKSTSTCTSPSQSSSGRPSSSIDETSNPPGSDSDSDDQNNSCVIVDDS